MALEAGNALFIHLLVSSSTCGIVTVVVAVTIIIIIIIIIIVIAFKGAIRDFLQSLAAPRTVSNTYAQVARAQSCANNL